MSVPEILARSRRFAELMLPRRGDQWAVVSIGASTSPVPKGFDASLDYHHRFEFQDINKLGFRTLDYDPPSEEDVRRLLSVREGLFQREVVLCHCKAGVSRSTAASFILRCAAGVESEKESMMRVIRDRPQASPNELMVRYADELLERNGRMIEAMKAVPDLKDRLGLR